MFELLAILHLIQLHGPGGQEIDVSVDAIVTMREPRENEISGDGHFPKGTHCVLNMSDGKINLVQEHCHDIFWSLEGKNR